MVTCMFQNKCIVNDLGYGPEGVSCVRGIHLTSPGKNWEFREYVRNYCFLMKDCLSLSP
jgi:hypothetical protein